MAGPRGLYAVAAVAGLTDIDAITLSSLRLFSMDGIRAEETVFAILLAFISNLVFKSGLVWVIGGWKTARHAIAGMGATAAGLVIGWLLTRV
jgi:uncharacterized membrane protein (DUF4010 family)